MPTDTANLIGGFLYTNIYIMITREDYLNALELIDKYNRQFNMLTRIDDILICDWVKKMDVSVRLDSALRTAQFRLGWERISDFRQKEFLKLQGVGKKCLMEFEYYLEIYKERNN